ncbi:MAG: PilZ domain-containing protein [Sphingomonas sp.]|uniref:PilZ domain-containing protein n=1 Tax=Sphingomonas sp. TaxID=28214 RepID=UPI002618DCAB|nr:PilZ domain-containing protein [Sphingomonas sp.]MDK2770316.1 PilZ domain-containing protein [Sphingomonas sp.]
MKQDEIGAPIAADGFAQVSELSVFDTATPATDRRASERDGPSRRGGPRVEVEAAVRLRGAAQGAIDARIFNLSAGGCGLFLKSGMFNTGDLVTIKIKGVENWPGTVKWCVGQEAGIAFDRPFYPAVFDAIVAIHKDHGPDAAQ